MLAAFATMFTVVGAEEVIDIALILLTSTGIRGGAHFGRFARLFAVLVDGSNGKGVVDVGLQLVHGVAEHVGPGSAVRREDDLATFSAS